MITIRIATDFSRYPAGRFSSDGPYSGEEFRKRFLEEPLREGQNVVVELDGTRGYGSSFLEEAFGGLVRAGVGKDVVLKSVELKTTRASLKAEIRDYMQEATPVPNAAL